MKWTRDLDIEQDGLWIWCEGPGSVPEVIKIYYHTNTTWIQFIEREDVCFKASSIGGWYCKIPTPEWQ